MIETDNLAEVFRLYAKHSRGTYVLEQACAELVKLFNDSMRNRNTGHIRFAGTLKLVVTEAAARANE